MFKTDEMDANLANHELRLSVPPDCHCGEREACEFCGTKTLVIEAVSLVNDASKRLTLTAPTDELVRVLGDALRFVDAGDCQIFRVMNDKNPLYHLLYGVEGEEWPRWLGHLPWDVREVYKRHVVGARQAFAEGQDA